ncbi:MAG: MarR family transcriptional regulator [Dehalococcoidales bacterium]|nr:MarR family transcriptional regulator [Dehalococcoidales bacterium]
MPEKKNKDNFPAPEEFKKVSEQIGQLNFWRCICFADTLNRYLEITMKKDDISPLHHIAMYRLVRAGGSLTPTQLSEAMFRSKHSVTKIMDNLEKEGFIVRDFSSKDRRVTVIRVTEAGLEYVRKNQHKAEIRAQQVMNCLAEADQETLTGFTGQLNNRMTELLDKM